MPRAVFVDGEKHLYRALARELDGAIASGTLKAGDRLPSTRQMSARYGVSMATAIQAFRELENRRRIVAKPRSGFFVASPPRRHTEPLLSNPPAVARHVVMPTLFEEYFQAMAQPGAVTLGNVNPPPNWFPGARLNALILAVHRQMPDLAVTYRRANGPEELRQALARRSVELGCRLCANEIVITNGCVEALNLCLRTVAGPGDTIALESPTYFMFLYILQALGLKALEIPTHPKTGVSLEALESATAKPGVVKAVLLMPNYSNPLGSLMPDEHKARLVQLCETRGLPLIEDDVYGDTFYGTTRPLPLKHWDRKGNVLYCSSFTKTLAPGLRIGWVAPGRHLDKLRIVKSTTTGFAPYAPQVAVARYIENGGYDRHLSHLRAAVAEAANRIGNRVRSTFPSECKMTWPSGGYALWIELPRKVDAIELFRRAREFGVVVTPGPLFTASNRFRNFIRLSHTQSVSPTAVDEAIATVGRLAGAMAAHALAA